LRQDAASLKERRRQRRKGGHHKTGSSSSSGDSGISDGYELYEQDLPRREEALNRLRAMAKQLEENLPPNSEALQGVPCLVSIALAAVLRIQRVGSGSVGSVCLWTPRIRIRIHKYEVRIRLRILL
jgi:hypothetical protein